MIVRNSVLSASSSTYAIPTDMYENMVLYWIYNSVNSDVNKQSEVTDQS